MVSKKFQHKLWKAVNECRTGAIKWSLHGDSVVFNFRQFKKEFLDPNDTFCKSNNLSSFIRQLNLYGFRKILDISNSHVVEDYKEYTNPNFVKGRPDLLKRVSRNHSSSVIRMTRTIKREVDSDFEDDDYCKVEKRRRKRKKSRRSYNKAVKTHQILKTKQQIKKEVKENDPYVEKKMSTKLQMKNVCFDKNNSFGMEDNNLKDLTNVPDPKGVNIFVRKTNLKMNRYDTESTSKSDSVPRRKHFLEGNAKISSDSGKSQNAEVKIEPVDLNANMFLMKEKNPETVCLKERNISGCILLNSSREKRDLMLNTSHSFSPKPNLESDGNKSNDHLNEMCEMARRMGVKVSERLKSLTEQKKISDSCAAFKFSRPPLFLLRRNFDDDSDRIFTRENSSKTLLSEAYRTPTPDKRLRIKIRI
ncbi:uncharacterized protein [Parasteatoda tepidariorum]|uniref:uncharacterized protein n=1 Tax=Parasteatoda tepidariorum TaxID=114398 RepID=UPI001C725177|nr:heat stress transcription factor A-3 [Parasteatoda tepidariorum]